MAMQACKTFALHVNVKSKAMKEMYLCSFLTSTLDYVSGQLHGPAALPVGEELLVLTQGSFGPRVWLDAC